MYNSENILKLLVDFEILRYRDTNFRLIEIFYYLKGYNLIEKA